MSSALNSLVKKHRHRVGLLYFTSGLVIGCLLAVVIVTNGGSGIRGGDSCVAKGNGWNVVNVFFGSPQHLKDNSAISNDYFDRVQWYSQARQDEVVAALLRNKKNGYFIDLAANDPVKISNTYALESNYNWRGLCIEPNPMYWAGLSYRKCDVVGGVVGQERMQQISFKFPNRSGPQGGIVGKDFDNKQESKFSEDRPRFTVTLLEVFERFNTPKVIDYMSLDVEGAETFIMKGFPFHKYRFNVITLERPSEELKTILTKNGYLFHKLLKENSGDTLWIHKSMSGKLDTTAADAIDTMKSYSELPPKDVIA